MAWSSTALTAAQIAKAAADKPLVLGSNLLRTASAVKWTTTGSLAGADQSAAGTSVGWLSDGFGHHLSKPNADAANWYLCFDFGVPVTFDAIWMLGPTLPTTLVARVADDSAFSVNIMTIATLSPAASAKRVSGLMLDHLGGSGRSYTSQYLRLGLSRGAPYRPLIGEVFVSARRQLAYQPDEPWDPSALRTQSLDNKGDTGITTRFGLARGQRLIRADLQADADPYRADLYSLFHSDLRDGLDPFVWVDNPSSAPDAACLMVLDKPELSYPYSGPLIREWTLIASEQGPYFRALEV